MFVKNLTRSDAANYRNFEQFDYAGGRVTYQMSNDATGGVFAWGDGKIRPVSGYFIRLGTGANATVHRNNANFRVVNWIFPTTASWKTAQNRTNNLLLNNRKW